MTILCSNTNTYNVRALRQKLEQYICRGAWNKFRRLIEKLTKEDRSSALLEAVVFAKSKTFIHSPSLLHLVLYYFKDSSSIPLLCQIVRVLTCAVPQVLLAVNQHYGQTVLHVAVDRQRPPVVVQVLCQAIHTALQQDKLVGHRNKKQNDDATTTDPFDVRDWRGDTPLWVAVQSPQEGYTRILLQYGGNQQTLVRKQQQRQQQQVPLDYIVQQELRTVPDGMAYLYRLTGEPQTLFLATHQALLSQGRRPSCKGDDGTPPTPSLFPMEDSLTNDNHLKSDQLLWEAVVGCATVLLDRRHALPFLDLMRQSHLYGCHVTRPTSGDASVLHMICRQPIDNDDDDDDDVAGNEVLFEHVWKYLQPPPLEDDNVLSRILALEDAQGNLPLHCAAALNRSYAATHLVRAYPAALRNVNRHGQLPLHTALRPSSRRAVSMVLWQADPNTLAVCDGLTGLAPFMLAAAEDPTETFELLVAAPDVLTRSLTSSAGDYDTDH